MKKIFLTVVLVLIGLVLYFWSGFPISDENQEQESEEVVLRTSPRDLAIEKYLESQKKFTWTTKEGSKNACVFENLGNEEDLFPLSLWVYCLEYILEDGKIKELSGSSGPVLVEYPNELSFFDLNRFSYQAPRDGSLYSEDIKKIFSQDVQDKIFEYQIFDVEGRNKLDKLKKIIEKKILGSN